MGSVRVLYLSRLTEHVTGTRTSLKLSFSSPSDVTHCCVRSLQRGGQRVVGLLLLGAESELVDRVSISAKAVGSALISPQRLFIRTLRGGTMSVVLLRGRPDKSPAPDGRSLLAAQHVHRTKTLVNVRLLSRVVVKSGYCFDLERGKFFSRRSTGEWKSKICL